MSNAMICAIIWGMFSAVAIAPAFDLSIVQSCIVSIIGGVVITFAVKD